jgi:hypothetical protein
MGGVAPNFSEWANGPGAGKGRDWDKPRGKYGVAQLSPWVLWPPDGLNLKQGTCGELFGYGYLPFATHGQSAADMAENWMHLAKVADDICYFRGRTADSVNHPVAMYQMNCGNRIVQIHNGSWDTTTISSAPTAVSCAACSRARSSCGAANLAARPTTAFAACIAPCLAHDGSGGSSPRRASAQRDNNPWGLSDKGC